MAIADLALPSRLLAGGGPSTPDPRVLRALATPLIGQFDPDFTAIMDETMDLARAAFMTSNPSCFPVSGLAAAGLEALLNTLVQSGDHVAVGGGATFTADATDILVRLGAEIQSLDRLGQDTQLVVVPLIDPLSGRSMPVESLARSTHALDAKLIVDATLGLAGTELRIDDWQIDACSAGVDFALGAPAGMALVTYTPDLEARMHARRTPPPTSYLDLLQLQAYWSAERLNHHTAPTSLVYALREALRLVHDEGLPERWARHRHIGHLLHAGLARLGLDVDGDPPYALVRLPDHVDEASVRHTLRERHGISVCRLAGHVWRLGLLGADARPDAVNHVLNALEHVLTENAQP